MTVNGNALVPVSISKARRTGEQLLDKEGFPMSADADPEFDLRYAIQPSHHTIQPNALFIMIVSFTPEGGHIAMRMEF